MLLNSGDDVCKNRMPSQALAQYPNDKEIACTRRGCRLHLCEHERRRRSMSASFFRCSLCRSLPPFSSGLSSQVSRGCGLQPGLLVHDSTDTYTTRRLARLTEFTVAHHGGMTGCLDTHSARRPSPPTTRLSMARRLAASTDALVSAIPPRYHAGRPRESHPWRFLPAASALPAPGHPLRESSTQSRISTSSRASYPSLASPLPPRTMHGGPQEAMERDLATDSRGPLFLQNCDSTNIISITQGILLTATKCASTIPIIKKSRTPISILSPADRLARKSKSNSDRTRSAITSRYRTPTRVVPAGFREPIILSRIPNWRGLGEAHRYWTARYWSTDFIAPGPGKLVYTNGYPVTALNVMTVHSANTNGTPTPT
ncbi:hypothetical protein DFH09DRAFT_1358035 [Mycena vulgaris]|nr:hypothetical protein DFH09DRAFT_1358035 [Mycena vulgaris]